MTRPLKWDDVVKNADGDLMIVRYVHPSGGVDVYPINGKLEDTVTLPATELKRVVDPRRKLPPITKMPAERPVCQNCGKKMLPAVDTVTEWNPHRVVSRTFRCWSGPYELFHSNGCAVAFAAAAHRAGYRIVKKTGR